MVIYLVPKDMIMKSKQLAASLFFSAVFGSGRASRAMNALIALSAFGNILAGFIGGSRVIRECGRSDISTLLFDIADRILILIDKGYYLGQSSGPRLALSQHLSVHTYSSGA